MKRFKNILFVSDGESQSVIEKAANLAKKNRARIKVIRVIKELPGDVRILAAAMHLADLQDAIVSGERKKIRKFVKPYKDKGVDITTKILIGTPFIEIVREVLRDKHDLLIVAATEKEGIKGMLFGSTTMHLMRKCPCPVWAIKPSKQSRLHRILAAVDPDPDDHEKTQLNNKIMELSVSLSRMEKGELHVVHVWSEYENVILGHRLTKAEIDQLRQDAFDLHESSLSDLLRRYVPQLPKKNIHFLEGDPSRSISALAHDLKIDLIVMGTAGRSGVAGFFIGNTAEKILHYITCSVLAVKPEGYVTPVTLE